MLSESLLAPDPARASAVERAWNNLTAAGPLLTSAERISIIATARAAWSSGGPGPGATTPAQDPAIAGGAVLAEAAHWLAKDAGGLTGQVVDDFERRGLDRFRYLEVVGVVARLSNVDFYSRGIGAPLIALPAADSAPPTAVIADGAGITDGWVPATGPLFAPASLDALPDEGDALRDIHEPMYMPMVEMGDRSYIDHLTRAQIEYTAARTSFLNECFY